MTQNSTTTTLPIPDEVEILKKYTADPHCKACHGTGRIGINHIFDKQGGSFYQLALCYCLTPVESEYMRLEKRLEKIEQALASLQRNMLIEHQTLLRHEFFGGIKLGWNLIRERWQMVVAKVKNLFSRKAKTAQ